jgi:hypothetical protein
MVSQSLSLSPPVQFSDEIDESYNDSKRSYTLNIIIKLQHEVIICLTR